MRRGEESGDRGMRWLGAITNSLDVCVSEQIDIKETSRDTEG